MAHPPTRVRNVESHVRYRAQGHTETHDHMGRVALCLFASRFPIKNGGSTVATLLEQARELKQDRAKLIKANRDLNDRTESEKRDFNAEETAEYNKRFEDINSLQARAERLELQDKQVREIPDPDPAAKPEADKRDDSGPVEYRTKSGGRMGIPVVERAYMLEGSTEQRDRHAAAFRASLVYPQFRTAADRRALENTDDTAGGYTTPPIQWTADLIKAVDDAVWIRGLARVTQLTSGDSMGRPSLDNDPADSAWTTELGTGDEDSTMDFGARELNPSPLAKSIKVSRTLLRRSALNIDSLVRDRLSYKQGITQEKAFMTGSGADQPLGVFTAATAGITTGRDVATNNTTTAFTADGLINAKFSIKGAYYSRLRWVFHRDSVKMLAKLKDGDGQYMWSGSIVAGEPDRLLGFPAMVSEYAPNTFTAGLYVGILGDFSNYWIAEALGIQIQRLDELYAATNQVGYIMRSELDGMPTLEEAFARVTLAP